MNEVELVNVAAAGEGALNNYRSYIMMITAESKERSSHTIGNVGLISLFNAGLTQFIETPPPPEKIKGRPRARPLVISTTRTA